MVPLSMEKLVSTQQEETSKPYYKHFNLSGYTHLRSLSTMAETSKAAAPECISQAIIFTSTVIAC